MDKAKNLRRILINVSAATGLGSIAVAYTYKGKPKRYPTGVKCNPSHFDKKDCIIKKGGISPSDNAIVDSLYNSISTIINDYLFKYNVLPTPEYIDSQMEKPEVSSENIHELYKEFISAKKRTIEDSTLTLYSLCGQYLQEADVHYNYKLNLFNLNYDFIEKFIKYLIEERGQQNSTINQHLKYLRVFKNWLNKKEIKHAIKPENWESVKKHPENMICLERNEFEAILKYKPENERYQKIKDIIVFLSHTGIRQIDLFNINKDHIKNGCIDFLPQKGSGRGVKGRPIRAIIPITKPVREILERYDCKIPTYTPKYLSANIKDLCSKIKELQYEVEYIDIVDNEPIKTRKLKHEVLTSHCIGRKTFINLCIERKVQLTTICGMTGHAKIDTIMRHYADKHANKQTALSEVFEM